MDQAKPQNRNQTFPTKSALVWPQAQILETGQNVYQSNQPQYLTIIFENLCFYPNMNDKVSLKDREFNKYLCTAIDKHGTE